MRVCSCNLTVTAPRALYAQPTPLVDIITCNVERRCLRRPGDARNGRAGQQENRERGTQREIGLSKRYLNAFSGADAIMKRAAISYVVAHFQMVFETASPISEDGGIAQHHQDGRIVAVQLAWQKYVPSRS